MQDATDPHVRVACFVRKSAIVAPLDTILRTLERFEAEDVIDEFTVGAWPAEVRLGDPVPDSDVVDLFEAFDAWADQWNVSIRPPFEVQTRESEITGETREVLVTPVRCLTVYVNGVLVEVFPHATDPMGDGETYTVGDALTLMETHDTGAFAAGQSPETPPDQRTAADRQTLDPGVCPACETRLVTGQGVYGCSNCDWVGIATGSGRYRSITGEPTPDRTEPVRPTGDSEPPTVGR